MPLPKLTFETIGNFGADSQVKLVNLVDVDYINKLMDRILKDDINTYLLITTAAKVFTITLGPPKADLVLRGMLFMYDILAEASKKEFEEMMSKMGENGEN